MHVLKRGSLPPFLCIKNKVTLNESYRCRSGNRERCLKLLAPLFADYPEALENTSKIAEACHVDSLFLLSRARFSGAEAINLTISPIYVRKSLWERMRSSEPESSMGSVIEAATVRLLSCSLGYCAVCAESGHPVASDSLLCGELRCHLPLGHHSRRSHCSQPIFGSIIDEGMTEAPDIDLDFAATRQEGIPDREEVIQYVYRKYGKDHVAMVCTYITFQDRSAIREVGKVLELPEDELDRMAKMVGHYGSIEALTEVAKTQELGIDFSLPEWQVFGKMALQEFEYPSAYLHSCGGMIIASRPIAELVPLEPARMEGRVVCQWDKDMVSDAGLIKVDILGIGMLAVVREAQQHAGCNLDDLSFDDPAVYDCISAADTVACFRSSRVPRCKAFLELSHAVFLN